MLKRKEQDLKLGKRIKSTIVSSVATVEGVATGVNDVMDVITGNLQEVKMEQRADTLRLYSKLQEELQDLGYTEEELDEYLSN
jgi:hypothetical protein